MVEEWKPIKNYPGYEVSNFGLVRNSNGKILTPEKTKKGYLRVDLSNKEGRKHHKVHRLVAISFIPNENNYPQINHKDECKTNNRVDNLEWCTNWYNAHYDSRRNYQYEQERLF